MDVNNTSYAPPVEDNQSILEVAMDGGFFSLIEMGMVVILMMILTITKIVNSCKKTKSTEEKIKILQETFDLKALTKLGVETDKQVSSDTLGAIVHAAAQQQASQLQQSVQQIPVQQSVTLDQNTIQEIVRQSTKALIASQPVPVPLPVSKHDAVEIEINNEETNWKHSRPDGIEELESEVTENLEYVDNISEYSHLSDCSVVTTIKEEHLLPNDLENIESFKNAIDVAVKNHTTTSKLKLTKDLDIDNQNYDYKFQLYDDNNSLLLTSTESLTISVLRDKYYKETIEQMIREDFNNLTIMDEWNCRVEVVNSWKLY